jgi:hypothetical protein
MREIRAESIFSAPAVAAAAAEQRKHTVPGTVSKAAAGRGRREEAGEKEMLQKRRRMPGNVKLAFSEPQA